MYHSKSCWLNAFAANLSFKNKYGSDACSMKRLVIKIIQSPEHIKIDARCYFTSKCKISPRVILEQISTFLLGPFCRGRSEKKYYIVPHLTKFVRGCTICRDILKLISWIEKSAYLSTFLAWCKNWIFANSCHFIVKSHSVYTISVK